MSSTFLQSKAAVVGEGCKYRRCFFCFPFISPECFFNSTLQPLLLKDSQRACVSVDFPSEPSQLLRNLPNLYKNIQENGRLFFFSKQFCPAEKKKSRSLVGSGDPRLDYFRPWGALPPKF